MEVLPLCSVITQEGAQHACDIVHVTPACTETSLNCEGGAVVVLGADSAALCEGEVLPASQQKRTT